MNIMLELDNTVEFAHSFMQSPTVEVNLPSMQNFVANPPFKFSKFTIAVKGASNPEHHPDKEIWLVAAGEGVLYVDGQSYDFGPGSVFTLQPHCRHYAKNIGVHEILVYSIWWGNDE